MCGYSSAVAVVVLFVEILPLRSFGQLDFYMELSICLEMCILCVRICV